MMDVHLEHIGVGCNRVVNAASWGPSGLVAFGAHHAVALYDPNEARVVATLPGHSDRVNCTEWLPRHVSELSASSSEPLLPCLVASGDASGSIILWAQQSSASVKGPSQRYTLAERLSAAHSRAVTCLVSHTLRKPNTKAEALLVSTSSDGTVKVWGIHREAQSEEGLIGATCIQTIALGAKAMMSAAVTELADSSGQLLLALGGLDNAVHLYVGSQDLQFSRVCSLSGHQDWVRSLDFAPRIQQSDQPSSLPLLLASGSQDRNVRIWKIAPRQGPPKPSSKGHSAVQKDEETASSSEHQQAAASSERETSSGQQARKTEAELSRCDEREGGETNGADDLAGFMSLLHMYAAGPVFRVGTQVWEASLESLLIGHEDWVHSVRWAPDKSRPPGDQRRPSILSASMDRTMMIWRPDVRTGLWTSEVTVGELGVSNLGFYTGLWAPDGNAILAHGYAGSFHLWRDEALGFGEECWKPHLEVSGHFAPVSDCEWDRSGRFLQSVSQDQTARITAHWERGGQNRGPGGGWHETSRSQVHGHDIHCGTWVGGEGDVSIYVSGSEEKVARVFQAPEAFLQTLRIAAGGSLPDSAGTGSDARDAGSSKVLGANMSALGLSQKPIYEAERNGNGTEELGMGTESFETVPDAAPRALEEPPLEEHLAQNTLWPEVRKLYGHGNELWCMAGDHSGRLLATASKAQSAAAAAIWLWDVATWQPVGQLSAHQLTVTQLAFSPDDDRFLLAVSRDRHLSLWERADVSQSAGVEQLDATEKTATPASGEDREEEGLGSWIKAGSYLDNRTVTSSFENGPPYRLVAKVEAHKRIVWAASWAPNGRHFATGSRDKLVKVWAVSDGAVRQVGKLPVFPEAVTALAWGAQGVLAVGLESGGVEFWHGEPSDLKLVRRLEPWLCHVAAVQRLRWKSGPPVQQGGKEADEYQLATCSADHSVRIFVVRKL